MFTVPQRLADIPVAERTAVISPVSTSAVDASRDWRRATVAAALLVTCVEAVLLQRKHGLFTGGFLAANSLGTWLDGVAFLGIIFLLNATVAAVLCGLTLVVGRAIRLRSRALRFAAFAAGSFPLLAADVLMYKVWSYLGDAFDLHLVFALTGRRVSEIFAVTAPLVSEPLVVGLLLVVGLVISISVLHRFQRDEAAAAPLVPDRSTLVRGCLMLLLLSGAVALGVGLSSESMSYGVRRIPAGEIVMRLLDEVTDFDRDGYGLLRNPRDTSGFDAAIHPYALEIPGNGVDENGLGGDLPVERSAYREPPPPTARWQSHPPVILFVLESFRADVVGAWYDGRRVTPSLDSLALQGAKVDSAWSHNGFTSQSRFHILTGSLTGRRGTSLLDDFKNNGYDVGYFSAQDDSAFGGVDINYTRVDKYYDARQDIARRYSTSTAPGSLAVPFNVLEEHIAEYLNGRQSVRPLFLYVNFHDTHYPYTYAGLPNMLGGDLLNPSLISPGRRGDLWRTYLNAASNVDGAIGRVITSVAHSVGVAPAVVVLSDHGESLFEGGFLGHGYALNTAQTRIPMIVSGLPMHIAVPFGQASLRDAVNDALARSPEGNNRPVIENQLHRRVFQYLGTLDMPAEIAWLTSDGQFAYDFRRGEVGLWGTTVKPARLIGEPRQTFDDLIHTWESIQLRLAAHQGTTQAAQ